MLKLLTRSLLAASLLVLAFAVPSAFAAKHSHSAIFHAPRHRGAHHGTATGKARRGKATRKTRRSSKSVRLVALNTTTTSAPLIGETAVESHFDSVNAGEAEAFRVQANASAFTGVAHIYIDAHNGARTLSVGLYSNASGHPGALLSSGSISTVQGGAWNAVTLTSASLTSGTTYWLAILGEHGTLRYRDQRGGPCPSETEAQSLGSLPSTWRTGSVYADCPLSGYVTAGESILGPPTPVEPIPPVVEPTPPVVKPIPPVVKPTPPVVEPAPPTPAPTNMALPAISGTPMEGKVLNASNGSWSGSPTSFKHQWQDCNKSGGSCTNIGGATAASYTLGSTDTGHMMRVTVTASNEGGSDAASSAPTAPVAAALAPPAPPTASFTVNPASPTVGQTVSFNGTASTCADTPCTYEWSDDGSATQPPTTLWPLGSGETLSFAFQEAGTKYVRLTVTDASGRAATVEHNMVVEAEPEAESPPPPPPPPAAPANTALPTINGTATEGQALNASNGSWTGSPSSYAYQWESCDSAGSNCVNIAGAASSSLSLSASEVGDTVRVVVTATNEGGATAATSAATATVAAVASPPPPPPAAPANTALPTISGTATEGQALNASNGSWTGSPTSFSYKWEDCDASGANCATVVGATAASYTLTAGDVGHTVRVVVMAGNEGGSTAATSTQTETVVAQQSSGGGGGTGGGGTGGGETCTTTISSVSQINSSLKAGAVVCLAAGTYGAVSITTTPSSNATLTAAPGAHVVVGGVNIAASNVTVSQLHSTGTINVGSGGPYPGFSHDIIEHNDVGPTNGYGISVMSATSTPSSYITVAYNRIHNTSATSEGDALRFDGWNHLTVEGNDIYEIKECPGSTCHTDTLQSYNGDVATTGLTITKNYTHDNVGAQGLPFLKDGDISNVTISDNLSLRNTNTNGQVTGVWVDENIQGLTITNNTYQGTSGSIVQADGSASNPTVAINHNVFDNINVRPGSGPSYTTTENYDIFTGNDEYTFNVGPNSLMETKPVFTNTAIDDYRLAKNPNHIGVDWSPAEVQFGPTN